MLNTLLLYGEDVTLPFKHQTGEIIMSEINNYLQSLRQVDPDLARVLDVYEQVDSVYRAALEAMGLTPSFADTVKNSANVTISFRTQESVQSLTVRG